MVIQLLKTPTNESVREKIQKAEVLMGKLRVSMAQDGVTAKVIPFVDEIKILSWEIDTDIRFLFKNANRHSLPLA